MKNKYNIGDELFMYRHTNSLVFPDVRKIVVTSIKELDSQGKIIYNNEFEEEWLCDNFEQFIAESKAAMENAYEKYFDTFADMCNRLLKI